MKQTDEKGIPGVLLALALSFASGVVVAVALRSSAAGVDAMVWVLMAFLLVYLVWFGEALENAMRRIFGDESMPDPFVAGPWAMLRRILEEKYGEGE